MARHWWEETVSIETDQIGKIQHVSSTEEAARWLMDDWPDDQGPCYPEAVRKCLAALEGRASHEEARSAFIAAAEEVDILIRGKASVA